HDLVALAQHDAHAEFGQDGSESRRTAPSPSEDPERHLHRRPHRVPVNATGEGPRSQASINDNRPPPPPSGADGVAVGGLGSMCPSWHRIGRTNASARGPRAPSGPVRRYGDGDTLAEQRPGWERADRARGPQVGTLGASLQKPPCSCVHELIHACGLENSDHADDGVFAKNITPHGAKVVAFGQSTPMPPLFLMPATTTKIAARW